LGLNADFLEASALAHDVGHGPAGHASEEAFSPYLPGGYDHAVYGADVLLTELNFTLEVIDAVRNHSWRRPSPLTPEAHVVSWADRIAYVSHDFDDAVRGGIITPDELPQSVREFAGLRQSEQLRAFVTDMHASTASSGVVSMSERAASALDDFRRFNYERIYLRPASKVQAEKVILMLRELVDYFIDAPGKLHLEEGVPRPVSGSPEAAEAAVRYVSGMTDRFALSLAVNVLGWAPSALPRGV
jgi:dGTPase